MKAKIISSILICSLVFYLLGCYNMYHIPREEFEAYDENGDIILTSKYSVKYEFHTDSYLIKSDTLLGSGIKTINDKDSAFVGQLPLDDIIIFQVEKKEAYKKPVTIMALWFMVVSGIAAALIYWITHPPW